MNVERESGGSFPISPKSGAYIIGIANLVFAVISTYPIKLFGRKKILFWGHVAMGCAHLMIGVFKVTKMYMALFITILVFIAFFQCSQGPLSFIYTAEVAVDSAIGIVISGQFLCMMMLTFSVPYMIESWMQAEGTFWFYGGLTYVAAVYVYFFIRETKGLTDQQKKELY